MSRFTKADLEGACLALGLTLEQPKKTRTRFGYYRTHDWILRSPKEDNVGQKKGYIFAHVSFVGSSGRDFKLEIVPHSIRTEISAETWRRHRWWFDELLEYLLYATVRETFSERRASNV